MIEVPRAAVILAAGMGTRLRGVFSELPKGFVEVGGETLIARSLRLLSERGIRDTWIVAGHLGHAYHDLAKDRPDVHVLDNPAYAETGSMASLALAQTKKLGTKREPLQGTGSRGRWRPMGGGGQDMLR